jgi:hypothetical protein
MTPKEKARELVDKFYNATDDHWNQWYVAKQCALIAVDEVQQLIKNLSSCKNRFIYIVDEMNYWEEVKQEIEKL